MTNGPHLSVEEAISARIGSLSPMERELLEKAATLGSVFWLGELVVLQRLDHQDRACRFSVEERARIQAALEELVEHEYLLRMPDSSIAGDIEYIFKHNLERDLVLARVPADRARRYYRAAAEWLEARLPSDLSQQTGEQLEAQATLYEKGGDRARAAVRYLAAADKARARYENQSAADLYARGLGLLEPDELLLRIDPLHDHGDVLLRLGRTNEALAAFEKMLEAAWRIDHAAKAGAAHGRIARLHRGRGAYDLAQRHFDQALELFRGADDLRGVSAVEDDLGRLAYLRGAYPQAIERHTRALERRRALGDARSIALSLHNLAMVHQAAGSHAEAMVHFAEALSIRREIDDRPGVAQSLQEVAGAWRDRGDLARSQEVLAEALELAEEIGNRGFQASILTRMGEVLAQLGRDAEAAERLVRANELARACGDQLLQSDATRLLAEVHARLGELGAARAEAALALTLAEAVGSRPAAGMAYRVLGMVLARGAQDGAETATAEEHLQRSIEILGEVGHELELGRSYQSYADVLGWRGDADGAATCAERAAEISQRLGPKIAALFAPAAS